MQIYWQLRNNLRAVTGNYTFCFQSRSCNQLDVFGRLLFKQDRQGKTSYLWEPEKGHKRLCSLHGASGPYWYVIIKLAASTSPIFLCLTQSTALVNHPHLCSIVLSEMFTGPHKPDHTLGERSLLSKLPNQFSKPIYAAANSCVGTSEVAVAFSHPQGAMYWKILRLLLLTLLSHHRLMPATIRSLFIYPTFSLFFLRPMSLLSPAFSAKLSSPGTSTLLLPHFQLVWPRQLLGCQTRKQSMYLFGNRATLFW